MVADDQIAQVRERTDIVALVQEYVPLKRVGASFKGLCPFHAEKTPSFYVHPGRQFFHCFGCQASGDVFGFFMQIEGRTFPEALRSLADRAGVELAAFEPQQAAAHRRARAREERLHGLMDAAAGFFLKQLRDHPLAVMANEELTRRGIRPSTGERFRLGYAPHGWDNLCRWLAERGWSPAESEETGLIVPRRSGSGHYDRFRHRLVFPITDHRGHIVAFSGRTLDPPPDEPLTHRQEPGAKYVNSPEGPLYRKGEVLFGLHEGRLAIRRRQWAIVCEGNFDLLALHQAGFEHSVAPMGTALTRDHVRLLKRYASRAVMLFDGDAAGRKAVAAAAPLLQRAGLSARVAVLPKGEDPDSYLRTRGSEALDSLIESAPGLVEYLIDVTAEECMGDARAKGDAIAGLGPLLAASGGPVEVRLYVERVAQKFGVSDIDAVRRQLRQGVRSDRTLVSRQKGEKRDRVQAIASDDESPLDEVEAELVGAVLDNPELFETEEAKNLEKLLTNEDLRSIFHTAARVCEKCGVVEAATLLSEVESVRARSWLNERLVIQKYDRGAAERALADGIPTLAHRNIERELPLLQKTILALRREGDHAKADALTRNRDRLFTSSKRLRQVSKR